MQTLQDALGAKQAPASIVEGRPYIVTRKIPRTNEVQSFTVRADYPSINRPSTEPVWSVSDIASELAYAVAYKRGLFNGDGKPRKPMAWAMKGVNA